MSEMNKLSEMNKPLRGLLIVFEGIDQSGKSSAAKRVKELLKEEDLILLML